MPEGAGRAGWAAAGMAHRHAGSKRTNLFMAPIIPQCGAACNHGRRTARFRLNGRKCRLCTRLARFLRRPPDRARFGPQTFQLETESVVRRLVFGLGGFFGLLLAIAAAQAAPQPAISLGVPAVLAMILVSAIAFLLERGKREPV